MESTYTWLLIPHFQSVERCMNSIFDSHRKNTPSRDYFIKVSTYRGLHFLLSESGAFSDGSGGSLLEGNTLQSLVHVQGVVSGDVLQLLLLFGGSWHFC